MRFLACIALLLAAGCVDNEVGDRSGKANRSSARDTCPGGCCWGMHSFAKSSTCDQCGAAGQAVGHRYCTKCAESLSKCQHCGGKVTPKQPAPRVEAPPPASDPEPPVKKADPPKAETPEPKAEAPKAELPAVKGEFKVEPVKFEYPHRNRHDVVVFAAAPDQAMRSLSAHRTKVAEDIKRLPPVKAGGDVGLYMIWGHYPNPTLKDGDLRATYDGKTSTIRVSLPKWSGRPGEGIGMDWARQGKADWPFVGHRVRIDNLPAGDYNFEVLEVSPTPNPNKEPKVLSSGTISLVK